MGCSSSSPPDCATPPPTRHPVCLGLRSWTERPGGCQNKLACSAHRRRPPCKVSRLGGGLAAAGGQQHREAAARKEKETPGLQGLQHADSKAPRRCRAARARAAHDVAQNRLSEAAWLAAVHVLPRRKLRKGPHLGGRQAVRRRAGAGVGDQAMAADGSCYAAGPQAARRSEVALNTHGVLAQGPHQLLIIGWHLQRGRLGQVALGGQGEMLGGTWALPGPPVACRLRGGAARQAAHSRRPPPSQV